jgi:hypothetical protein
MPGISRAIPDRTALARQHERIAGALVDAFNSRDPGSWTSVFHPDVEFRPTALIGSRSVYKGHPGVLCYIGELTKRGASQRTRIRRVQVISADRFVLYTEVLLGAEVVSPGAVIIRLADRKIIEATAYLSDEKTLQTTGLAPPDEAQDGAVSEP